ncbi:rhomboid family intramembrane serine protease [Mucilaginibacter lutimaris]|uniref:Rhomboid family intramembrane serine protease n=1 Tax=Mucilaginibacter lutimaris TaxID=931629 RepID=A0ABW2ZE95_9SPHI
MPNLISILAGRPVSVTLLVITTAVSVQALRSRSLYLKWILHPYSIFKRREYRRMITSDLIHNDPVHLLINAVLLFLICGEFEEFLRSKYLYGSLILLLIYLVSHLSGALAVCWSNRNNYDYSSAGASGSILGCMMGFMILAPHYVAFYFPLAGEIRNQYAALLVIVGLIVYKWRSGNIMMDNELHFFSALGGILTTILYYPGLIY